MLTIDKRYVRDIQAMNVVIEMLEFTYQTEKAITLDYNSNALRFDHTEKEHRDRLGNLETTIKVLKETRQRCQNGLRSFLNNK